MFRDAVLIAGKDLRIEARSRVATNQIGPFALLVLILFAFALDPDRGILTRATAGLFWITVLFCTLLAIQRAFSIESADGNRDALRLTTLDPAGIFLGKAAAVALELLGLEVLLLLGVVVLYDASLNSAGLLVLTSPDRLHAEWLAAQRTRGRTVGRIDNGPSPVERLLAPLSREARLVTVLDGHPLALSWLGSVRGQRVVPLGVESFGQSGDIPDLYRTYRLDTAAIIDAVARALA